MILGGCCKHATYKADVSSQSKSTVLQPRIFFLFLEARERHEEGRTKK